MKTRCSGIAISILMIALASCALPATAQDESEETGEDSRWIAGIYFGAGYASISTPSDEGLFDPQPSTPDDWSIGGAVVGNLGYRTLRDNYVEFVGAAWFGTLDGSLGDEKWTLGFLGGAYRFYPWDEGLYVRAGFGVGTNNARLDTPAGELKFDDWGIGILGSVGFDVALAKDVYVGPLVDVLYVDVGNNVNALLVTTSLGVLWR
jgi:hypothetical protein